MPNKFIIIIILLFSFSFCKGNDTLILNKKNIKPSIAFALSGGGARGIAHLGVIKELQNFGYEPDYIVGTSVGAIIGGLYAGGYSTDELENILTSTEWEKIFSFKDINKREELFLDQKEIMDRSLISLKFKDFKLVVPKAVSEGSNLLVFLQKHFWNAVYKSNDDFSKLKIPFSAVATDLTEGKSVLLERGNIVNSVKASATIPITFTPVKIDSMILIDGGIFSNVPVEYAKKYSPDIVIAINTTSPLLKPEYLNSPWRIADQTISVSIRRFNEESLNKADIVFEPDLKNFSNTDFSHSDSIVRLGMQAVDNRIKKLNDLYESKSDSILKNIDAFIKNEIKFTGFDSQDFLRLVNLPADKISANLKNFLLINKYHQIDIINSRQQTLIKAYKNNLIRNIEITGISGFVNDSLSSFVKNKYTGTFKNDEVLASIKESIIKYYRKNGYSFATVNYYEKSNDIIVFEIDEREVKEIILKNDEINPFLIKRNLTIEKGKPLNADDIIESWNNLYNTEYFEELDIIPTIPDDDTGAIVEIAYTESPSQFIRLGARIDNEYNTQAGIDFTQENLFNLGHRITARFELSNRYQNALLFFQNPRIFSSDYTASMIAYYKRMEIFHYRTKPKTRRNIFEKIVSSENLLERFGFNYSIGKQFEKLGLIEIAARYEKQRFFNLDSSKGNFNDIFTIKPALLFDSENDSFFPDEGEKIELSLETNLMKFENSIPFTKVYFYYRFHRKFLSGTVTPSLEFGVSDRTLPESEFFYLGGRNNFFGLRQFAERGRQSIKASFEYRYKLPFRIFFDTYVSGRYDLGSVWLMPESVKFNSLIHGVGLTLALDTPLGASMLSVGRSFYFLEDPNGIAASPHLIYFSIGLKM